MTDDTMKLWLLLPWDNLSDDDDPWEPWYDKAFGFVVRAPDEQTARQLAHDNAGYENEEQFFGKQTAHPPWLDPDYSTCVRLTDDGPEGVVIRDFASA